MNKLIFYYNENTPVFAFGICKEAGAYLSAIFSVLSAKGEFDVMQ